jgi:hypothetical protein
MPLVFKKQSSQTTLNSPRSSTKTKLSSSKQAGGWSTLTAAASGSKHSFVLWLGLLVLVVTIQTLAWKHFVVVNTDLAKEIASSTVVRKALPQPRPDGSFDREETRDVIQYVVAG